MKDIDIPISEEYLYDQLTEECSELIHAAAKLSRIIRGVNPTPKTRAQAYTNLLEEIADVEVCIQALRLPEDDKNYIESIKKSKIERWKNRVKQL